MQQFMTFYRSSVGKKILMAVTGIFMFLFVFVHMVGNLQIYIGSEALNRYSHFLHSVPEILWFVRVFILFSLIVHVWAAFLVWLKSYRAKPVKYRVKVDIATNYASRTMIWTGPIVLAFVIFHLLDLTYGQRVASVVYSESDVYHNIIAGFQYWPLALTYILANLLLGFHLYHGLWSLFQTLGLEHPLWNKSRKTLAVTFAVIVAGCNISIPASIWAGLVH
ncbi:MAG: succinate dehydrogenase cytochrome b subunit [Deltaproteobacteria bacterium]|nr:succinate dehydrogenase cytochrome b subunit [Deltaproteobacteria bacterium]